MKSLYTAAAGVLLLAAMAFGLGVLVFEAGRTKERVIWLDRDAKQAQDFSRKLLREVDRGIAASAKYQADHAALQASYSTLEGQYAEVRRRVSLVLAPAVPARRTDGQSRAVANAAPGPRDQLATPGAEQPGAVGVDYRLSRAAVWMWNSSLAGSDVPAGSCGLADTSSEACAVDSGFTVDDAWDNHHINAKSCASDRLRFRSLIEFITERPAE
ncbi:hypothetical protein BH10PSE18_BH10PSE18_18930 [soil metagenome]